MYRSGSNYRYSPSDLNAFLENECVTWLDRLALERPGTLERDEASEEQELVRSTGDCHEAQFLDQLRRETDVAVIDTKDREAAQKTLAAMQAGRAVIYQARLEREEFGGWADFLFRVDGDSELGAFHYEVWDTKLARSMKPYFAIQLCCYAEMLEPLQGRRPRSAGIILGNGERRPLRVDDYWYYYQAVKRAFLEQQRSFDADAPPLFPGNAGHRHWSGYVERMLEERDDVSRTANIRSSQVEKLAAAGITTMRGLAGSKRSSVPKMAPGTFQRLRAQARLQRQSQAGEAPAFELLPAESPRHGFGMLPPPSQADVCFDMEGYPLMDGGLEYLFGAVIEQRGKTVFRDWWAHDSRQEQAAFEGFIDWAYARWRRDPSMHIYHYAAYEPSALKRLMCRYATREKEVDDLLRHHVLVDLYTVVRQAVLVGEPGYSLKNVEHLYQPRRDSEVASAGDSIVYYHRFLSEPDGADWRSSSTLRQIRDYNKADCLSTWRLLEWLRARQAEAGQEYVAPEPPPEVSAPVTERAELAREMLADLKADASMSGGGDCVHALLAHVLEFHRREQKSQWWALFQRAAMTQEDLIEGADCLGGLERTSRPPQLDKQSFVHEYRYPEQESKLRAGSKCLVAADTGMRLVIHSLDTQSRKLTIRRGMRSIGPPERMSLIPDEMVNAQVLADSIERTVRAYHSAGTLPRALEDFLHRRAPRCRKLEDPLRAATSLKESALIIQGPPGSGKTVLGGKLIAELIRSGKRVGISSNSHHAIALLMNSALEAAAEMDLQVCAAKCGEEGLDQLPEGVIGTSNADLFKMVELPRLVGATAWGFSRPEAEGQFDYLFVDEAGQVSVANLVAMAPAAKNLMLLGDQMQLSQPTQGVHPGESGLSVLDYYLQEHATVPAGRGIFLPTTYRMRPELCSFISAAVYEGRLQPDEVTAGRSLNFDKPPELIHATAGIVHVPVAHGGNVCESAEEVEAVVRIIAELTAQAILLPGKKPRRLAAEEILVVAPFNLQVQALQAALPGVRVGTVDKFQGQQAPVVIFSMAASEGDAPPRGAGFLFDVRRMNVALSRAQILAVLVASPRLERTHCSSLEQMRMVNLYCRAAQEGAPKAKRRAGR
jgi:uncharacterized protein